MTVHINRCQAKHCRTSEHRQGSTCFLKFIAVDGVVPEFRPIVLEGHLHFHGIGSARTVDSTTAELPLTQRL